jgi:hypothetical protein
LLKARGVEIKRKLTDFGKKVRHLADDRDIYYWKGLHRAMQREGDSVSRQQMMNYVYGDSEAPGEFVRSVAAALDLTEDEKKEIAYSWAYEQGGADKERFRTPVLDVAERLGWDEEERKDAAYRYCFGERS